MTNFKKETPETIEDLTILNTGPKVSLSGEVSQTNKFVKTFLKKLLNRRKEEEEIGILNKRLEEEIKEEEELKVLNERLEDEIKEEDQ